MPAAAAASRSSSIPAARNSARRSVERLARRLALVLVLPQPPQPMVLLGEVGELEVEAERAQHLGLALERELADRRREIGPCPGAARPPRLPRERADALLVGEQLLPFLLDEDAAEDLAEQPDVPPERCLRVA